MRLSEAFEDFEAYLQASKKSPNTLKAYRADLHMVAEALVDPTGRSVDELQLEDLTVSNLRRAFATRAGHTAASSLARTHTTWTRLCKFLRSEGLIDVNPMDEIERAKVGRDRPKSIEDDQVAARLLAAAADPGASIRSAWPARDLAAAATLVTTGVRLAELVALNMGSITGEVDAWQLDVRGKGDVTRTIPLTAGYLDVVNQYQAERRNRFPSHDLDDPATPLLVHATTGERMTARQVQYLIERLYRASGLRAKVPAGALVHALRHTFAMDLLDHGANIVEVQRLLGHESLNTTRRYLDARPHELRNAIASLASVHQLTDREDHS